ncbi:hypothetical protein OFO10_01075 [Campylobacter sp. VBCF_06 NA8]|uniref:hypothetical protein n=1 Tax=Campylobacter sp. VBCF_06 NA8 TaxID=2983822 RepID=UPI0022E9E13B|nr:hypothetical protein [Campylobacter sp. VBCF_06 NA8]MDA3045744.1 hypothetical protein [Campylobacter sp. VBCF_06 NA8]
MNIIKTKILKSFANAFYMTILTISVYYLLFITFELNFDTNDNTIFTDNKGEALLAGFKFAFLFAYLFVFLFILNLVIYAVISCDKFDSFMEIIKKISAYLFALPVIFSFILLYFLPMLDTNFKNFLFSLIPNLYTLFVIYFVLKKSNLGDKYEYRK